ncbi:TPA: hypothetical protein I9097_000140 [Clostridium perfringens]|uniref:hypothetical protein n=1 Tax=Clostridium perfringens TaxID=1502 RepID=UPI001A23796A|nr:hypothetical protein [Clostridium perfringens]WCM71344.1 hypothetical protein LZD60_08195 [Clostridium perfringens]HAT4312909.1 hypothetical protein [Clostridium perfringens]
MEYKIKELKRAYRDINNMMNDILDASSVSLYRTYLLRFFEEVDRNEILKLLLNPYFYINTTNIVKAKPFGVGNVIDLPSDKEIHIAFVLQRLKMFSEMETSEIGRVLFSVYNKKSLFDNVKQWNHDYVTVVFREISIKISDLIEDVPNCENEIRREQMTIINYGNYNSANGQVANGNQNTLTNNINSDDIFKELVEKVNNNVKEDEKQELIELIEDLKADKGKPGFKEKLNSFISKTTNYLPAFIDLWGKLNELVN